MGFQPIMPHSFSWPWSVFYKMSPWHPYLHIDPALLAFWLDQKCHLIWVEQVRYFSKFEAKIENYRAVLSMIEIRTRKLRRCGLAKFCPVNKEIEETNKERERGEEEKEIVTKGEKQSQSSEFLSILISSDSPFLSLGQSCLHY